MKRPSTVPTKSQRSTFRIARSSQRSVYCTSDRKIRSLERCIFLRKIGTCKCNGCAMMGRTPGRSARDNCWNVSEAYELASPSGIYAFITKGQPTWTGVQQPSTLWSFAYDCLLWKSQTEHVTMKQDVSDFRLFMIWPLPIFGLCELKIIRRCQVYAIAGVKTMTISSPAQFLWCSSGHSVFDLVSSQCWSNMLKKLSRWSVSTLRAYARVLFETILHRPRCHAEHVPTARNFNLRSSVWKRVSHR